MRRRLGQPPAGTRRGGRAQRGGCCAGTSWGRRWLTIARFRVRAKFCRGGGRGCRWRLVLSAGARPWRARPSPRIGPGGKNGLLFGRSGRWRTGRGCGKVFSGARRPTTPSHANPPIPPSLTTPRRRGRARLFGRAPPGAAPCKSSSCSGSRTWRGRPTPTTMPPPTAGTSPPWSSSSAGTPEAATYLANLPFGFKGSLDASWLGSRDDVWCVHYDSNSGNPKEVRPTEDTANNFTGVGPLSPRVRGGHRQRVDVRRRAGDGDPPRRSLRGPRVPFQIRPGAARPSATTGDRPSLSPSAAGASASSTPTA